MTMGARARDDPRRVQLAWNGQHVHEFSGRHNQRPIDTVDQMAAMVRGMDGKRLRYTDPITQASV